MHQADKNFDLCEYLVYLNRVKLIKWKEIFWMVWMQLQVFTCLECKQEFNGTDLNGCIYHEKELELCSNIKSDG